MNQQRSLLMIDDIRVYTSAVGLVFKYKHETIGRRPWEAPVVWSTDDADLIKAAAYQSEYQLEGMVMRHADVEYTLGRLDACPMNNCYESRFTAPGNPDHGQTGPLTPPQLFRARTVEELVADARRFIGTFDLGGGNWARPKFYRWETSASTGKLVRKPVGWISYNGRITTVEEDKAEKAAAAKAAAEAAEERGMS